MRHSFQKVKVVFIIINAFGYIFCFFFVFFFNLRGRVSKITLISQGQQTYVLK